jgi:hypothetical protein
MSNLSEFNKSARELSKNPLGIIALFIVLIYGMASIVVLQGNHLTTYERNIFVWFLVTYPVLVLLAFVWLVSRHSSKLYAPRDFHDQEHWMQLQKERALVQARARTRAAVIVAAGDESSSNGIGTPNGSRNGITPESKVSQSKPAIKNKAKKS